MVVGVILIFLQWVVCDGLTLSSLGRVPGVIDGVRHQELCGASWRHKEETNTTDVCDQIASWRGDLPALSRSLTLFLVPFAISTLVMALILPPPIASTLTSTRSSCHAFAVSLCCMEQSTTDLCKFLLDPLQDCR